MIEATDVQRTYAVQCSRKRMAARVFVYPLLYPLTACIRGGVVTGSDMARCPANSYCGVCLVGCTDGRADSSTNA